VVRANLLIKRTVIQILTEQTRNHTATIELEEQLRQKNAHSGRSSMSLRIHSIFLKIVKAKMLYATQAVLSDPWQTDPEVIGHYGLRAFPMPMKQKKNHDNCYQQRGHGVKACRQVENVQGVPSMTLKFFYPPKRLTFDC